MKALKGLLVLLFAVSLLSSCSDEEDYVKPSTDVEETESAGRDGSRPKPGSV